MALACPRIGDTERMLRRRKAEGLMAQALYAPLLAEPAPELAHRAPNMARFVFLDPRSRSFFPNWQQSLSWF